MQDFEVLERLTKAEERTKSNTHRLDKLEPNGAARGGGQTHQ